MTKRRGSPDPAGRKTNGLDHTMDDARGKKPKTKQQERRGEARQTPLLAATDDNLRSEQGATKTKIRRTQKKKKK